MDTDNIEAKAVTSTEKHNAKPTGVFVRPQDRALHDPEVTLEEYMYYASKTRAEEDVNASQAPKTTIKDILFPSSGKAQLATHEATGAIDQTLDNVNLNKAENRAAVSDLEWTNASRALRSASAAAAFYLITTDILGPFGIGFAFGTMGWGQGITLFTVFGACAGFSGYLLWKVFLFVDSYEFAARNYGDLAFRMQAIQLTLSVGLIVISNGQSISQVSKLCAGAESYSNKFGLLANWAIVINLLIMFISMGVMAHSPPNYSAAQAGGAGAALGGASITQNPDGSWPAVVTHGGVPPSDNGFVGGINGLMQGVYAYGGAQLFVEFIAELQRPRDFLKAMWGAQLFIYVCYLVYGAYVYNFQGQYANQLSYQGLSPYAWQTVCNILAVISGLIAAVLYGNIGIKVLYNSVLVELLHAPPLYTKQGKLLRVAIVPVYWSIAFVIAASIPDFFGLTSVTAAVCAVQFTYTFPALLGLGLFVKRGAMIGEPEFNPANGEIRRRDSGVRRFVRGFFGKYLWLNIILLIYLLGSLAVSGLGSYSAISGLISAFKQPQVTAFMCHSPLEG